MASVIKEKKAEYVAALEELKTVLKTGYYVSPEMAPKFIRSAVKPFSKIDKAISAATVDLLMSIADACFMRRVFPCPREEFDKIVDDLIDLMKESVDVTVSQMSIALCDEFIKNDSKETTIIDYGFNAFIGYVFVLQSRFDWMEVHADFEETCKK